jgi:GAF domain-containing protein
MSRSSQPTATGGRDICAILEKMTASGAPLEEILRRAVEELHASNERFHWTGIYELFPDNVLRLGPFIGAPTDHVFIGVGQGVCGTAVAQNRNINVPDVSKAPNYLACSAATRSELVVLIRKGRTIYAQIDIDSHVLDAFDQESVHQVERVADCLARAYARGGAGSSGGGGRG